LDSDPFRPGAVFAGRYEIIAKLGEGGFGQVYRARQLVTHQEVAIKVLRSLHTANETHIARFQREMQLCAQLYHPNIVRLIDSGREEPELLFTVFEYLPGRTLTEVLTEEGALSAWEATQLMLQVLDALACAHNRGVIHRDLKPQNLMVTHTGVRRNALVLDFGLGTLPSENQEDLARITRTQEVLGTPTYASPEQLRGAPVTARSDLYSWGLIFLECLTGKRAVDGPTLQAVIFKQLGPEPITIPEWLEHHRLGRLLRRVTNKNPELRDISAQSVIRELEACAAEGWPEDESAPRSYTPSELGSVDTIPSLGEGERRQLTAICCSVRLSGAGAEAMDDEDRDSLLGALQATCAESARQYEGHIGSVLGEWILFYFGYPRAQENDARRAARAALQMRARMEQRAAELEREGKGRLEFRVGIHTGLVISQESRSGGRAGQPALMGSTPNMAVRLEMQAQLGTLLLSEVTAKLLQGHFAIEPVEAGASASAPVFRLLHELKHPSQSQLQDKQLYGREQELDFLRQRWAQVAAGNGQSVLLTGEPGIGKSRLVQELIRVTRSTPQAVLESRCVPEGRNSAFSPMVDLLERQLGIGSSWTPEQTVSALEALLSRHHFVLPEVMPLFLGLLSVKAGADRYPPLAFSPAQAKEQTLDALVDLFLEMARQQPLLLAVEDVHWADPTTLELLSLLVKEIPSERVCLVLTARPEFFASWTTSHHLQLNRLDRKRVEEMVSGLTQDKLLPRQVLEQLVNRTDGVPLFVEELTRNVVESISPRGETPSSSWTPSQLFIPTTLRDSLMARLDRLGAAKEVAQLASALGREFSYEVLKAISQRDEPALQHELKALVDADLVHRRRGVRNPVYLFKHALIRDTAYESMLKPVRRQVHARIAATMEARFPELVELRPDLLAMHHAAADQKRQALGYAQKAGMAALVRSANLEAVAYITEALGWLDAVEDERERAQLELGLNGILTPASMVTWGWTDERIKALVERSQQLIDFLGDIPQTVPTVWSLWYYYHCRSQHEQAWASATRLMTMAEQAGDTGLKLMALNALANTGASEGSLMKVQEWCEQVFALYDPEQHAKLAALFAMDARIGAAMIICLVKYLQGYEEQALAFVQKGMAWAEEVKHFASQGLLRLYHLIILQGRGARGQVIAVADVSLELARKYGLTTHISYLQLYRSWATRDEEGMRNALVVPESIGQEIGKTYYRSLLVELQVENGHCDAALEAVNELITWGRTHGEAYVMANLLRLRGLCLRARREYKAAEASLWEAVDVARTQAARMWELKALVALCELLQEQGEATEARRQLSSLLQWFTEGLDMPAILRARELLGQSPA